MTKRDKNFKLPLSVKRRMATIIDANKKNLYKNLMIEAEIASFIVVKDKKKKQIANIEVSEE